MSIRFRALLVLVILSLLSGGIIYRHIWKSLEVRYREAVEENLVDQSRILAAMLSTGTRLDSLAKGLDYLRQQQFQAQIYDYVKNQSRMRVYVTDSTGHVLYHSEDPAWVGQDFSAWRDVALTLQGKYGARSTRDEYRDESSSVLYVAAPIMNDKKIVGVVTVAKPAEDFEYFIEYARAEMLRWLLWIGVGVLVIGTAASLWIASPMGSLRRYARELMGHQAPNALQNLLPGAESREIKKALADLDTSLRDKEYVERYVQVLTHELKSPLSAIQGAAEILEGNLADDDRRRFLDNIHLESARIRELVDAILRVSTLERQEKFAQSAAFSLDQTLLQAVDAIEIQAHRKELTLNLNIDKNIVIIGDAMLMRQALHNLLLNAVEHSPAQSMIDVNLSFVDSKPSLFIRDYGHGIPDYAMERMGEKFYSLPKPDTGRKGTGLGLSMVREVARLHHLKFGIENAGPGARAWIGSPISTNCTKKHKTGVAENPRSEIHADYGFGK